MKKFLKIFLFALMLVSGVIFVSCGKTELTGLHKEFDIIFNGIKEEVTTEFKNNMTSLEDLIYLQLYLSLFVERLQRNQQLLLLS